MWKEDRAPEIKALHIQNLAARPPQPESRKKPAAQQDLQPVVQPAVPEFSLSGPQVLSEKTIFENGMSFPLGLHDPFDLGVTLLILKEVEHDLVPDI